MDLSIRNFLFAIVRAPEQKPVQDVKDVGVGRYNGTIFALFKAGCQAAAPIFIGRILSGAVSTVEGLALIALDRPLHYSVAQHACELGHCLGWKGAAVQVVGDVKYNRLALIHNNRSR